MSQFLVAIHHPDSFESSDESEATVRAIDALNEEMAAAGVVVFLAASIPSGRRSRCGRSPMAR